MYSMQRRALALIGGSVAALVFSAALVASADEPSAIRPVLKVPDGFTIELVVGDPLVDRPITAAFDDQGRLYVGDSSGSNDPVEKQLAQKPHRIVRLEDTDQDGRFDRSTVFADQMMFPEGTLFFDGSLYVSAPPSIWKLTDTDNDGVADRREEWFQSRTLTNCANDLHGPYLGLDGWIYWCKGYFGEQSHMINGRNWTTRAAHIFRCRPDGTGLEPVMTGGMDNPVDVAFTPTGERIFTSTFLVHPGNGNRDGLGHAIYGGLHGKEHGALEGHPRTGDLMPVLLHMGAAAPCGLERYNAEAWGDEYRDNLFACQFNLRKVSRHVLKPEGATFTTENLDFVTSEEVDFHPTDVLVDADGSLLVIDTGGWYKLCCPTSQLWKPDVLGGIYRVRKQGMQRVSDPRGAQIAWKDAGPERLWNLLGDPRPVVRQRATRELCKAAKTPQMQRLLQKLATSTKAEFGQDAHIALERIWALAWIQSAESAALVRSFLHDEGENRRHVALQIVSLNRDAEAVPRLREIVKNDTAMNRRLAAEALGRIGDRASVPALFAAADATDDALVQHAIIYALIEVADVAGTRAGLAKHGPGAEAAALIALDQMPGGGLQSGQVVSLLDSSYPPLSHAARWLVTNHPEWGADLAQWLGDKLQAVPGQVAEAAGDQTLEKLLVIFAADPAVQKVLASALEQADSSVATRRLALAVMSKAKPAPGPQAWFEALTTLLRGSHPELMAAAVATARELPPPAAPIAAFDAALLAIADNPQLPAEVRLPALARLAGQRAEITPDEFELLIEALPQDRPVETRAVAAEGIAASHLSPTQLERLITAIKSAGPLELHNLLNPFAHSTDERLGLSLVTALKEADARPALRIDRLREIMAKYGPPVQQSIDELHALLNVDLESQRQRIAELLPHMSEGSVRRGHAVFYSTKASCSACHRMGFAGGMVGPDLTRIGETRTERDLLESIVFPSLSFVRSFEPVVVTTTDGRAINGLIRNQTNSDMILATGPNQEIRLSRELVDEVHPSGVSVMPAGLDRQLTVQELADLVAFLKNPTKQ